jgi:hypothetical protein
MSRRHRSVRGGQVLAVVDFYFHFDGLSQLSLHLVMKPDSL